MASKATPTRPKGGLGTKPPHIANQPVTWKNWPDHVAWVNVTATVFIHIYGIYEAFYTPLVFKTAIWTLIYYFVTGLGITAGMFIGPFSEW